MPETRRFEESFAGARANSIRPANGKKMIAGPLVRSASPVNAPEPSSAVPSACACLLLPQGNQQEQQAQCEQPRQQCIEMQHAPVRNQIWRCRPQESGNQRDHRINEAAQHHPGGHPKHHLQEDPWQP